MRRRVLLTALLLSVSVFAQEQTLTDAQLLKAERLKSAFYQLELMRVSLEAQKVALDKELCGTGRFDFQASACAQPETK